MAKLFWLILGLFGGIIISRNSENMSTPHMAAVYLACIVGCGICWFAAYRGKKEAVATAVAIATATANANAEANARSVATSAITLILGSQSQSRNPDIIEQIVNESIENQQQYSTLIDHATTKEIA